MNSPEMPSQTVDNLMSGVIEDMYRKNCAERIVPKVNQTAAVRHIIDHGLSLFRLIPEEAGTLNRYYEALSVATQFTVRFSGHYPLTDSDINLVLVAGLQNNIPTTRIVRLDIIQENHLDANPNY